tara:strand:- start:71 stop:985 length:915 start_codon:yes stop_codon:yes gene_type:complete
MTISNQTPASCWEFINVEQVSINDREPVSPEQAKEKLSRLTTGVANITLLGGNSDQHFNFQFAVAKEEHLQGVDDAVLQLAQIGSLSVAEIENFNNATSSFHTASNYKAAIANYFYGALAREGSEDSRVSDYRAKYNQSVEVLKEYSRPIAETICGLVEFHYNDFEQAALRRESQRIAVTSSALLQLLDCRIPNLAANQGNKRSLDFVFSDAKTEQVLRLCLSALTINRAEETERKFEDAIAEADDLDRMKLRVAAAEYCFRNGRYSAGLEQAETSRHEHHKVVGRWANYFINRVNAARGNNEH